MSPRPLRGAVMAVVLFLCGCVGASGGALLNAAINTGIAVGTSAVSRSQGGCYAACPVGTRCNNTTGYCDPIPCRGECDPFQECIEDRLTYRCVTRAPSSGKIIVNPPTEQQKPSDAPSTEQKPADPKP